MPDERIDVERQRRAAKPVGEAVPPSEGSADRSVADGDDSVAPSDPLSAVEGEAADELREEWGADFDANLALAQEAVHTVADDELLDLLEESGLGNDPRIVRAAARIGRLLRSGQSHIDMIGDADRRDALEETLDELSRRPDYWTDRVQQRVRQIHLSLYGDQPIAAHAAGTEPGSR